MKLAFVSGEEKSRVIKIKSFIVNYLDLYTQYTFLFNFDQSVKKFLLYNTYNFLSRLFIEFYSGLRFYRPLINLHLKKEAFHSSTQKLVLTFMNGALTMGDFSKCLIMSDHSSLVVLLCIEQ